MAKPKNEEKKDETILSAQDILNSQLKHKDNKADHYNDSEEVEEIKVSTGSLTLDAATGGGFGAGLIRMVGVNEGGKTSEALEVAKNFLKSVPKSRVLLVKAEGRLSREMRERAGLNFVWKAEDWVVGTCFVLETNVYDLVVNIMRDLVVQAEAQKSGDRYCFILDSMDGLILKSDRIKETSESGRIAGAPSLTKKFLQRLAIAMNKFGHMCIMIGQVSSRIDIESGPKEIRQIAATGGNAALHFANWILEFQPRFGKDMIAPDIKAKFDLGKNRIRGHWANVIIRKSTNETTNTTLTYPIKYGRKGGSSIWLEKEVADALLKHNLLEQSGSWLKLMPPLYKRLTEAGIVIEEKYQGYDNFTDFLDANPAATKMLFDEVITYVRKDFT